MRRLAPGAAYPGEPAAAAFRSIVCAPHTTPTDHPEAIVYDAHKDQVDLVQLQHSLGCTTEEVKVDLNA